MAATGSEGAVFLAGAGIVAWLGWRRRWSPLGTLAGAFLAGAAALAAFTWRPGADATALDIAAAAAVAASDDHTLHAQAFAQAAARLVRERRCTVAELRELGGWLRAAPDGGAPRYFTYCGGTSVRHRIYLDPASGRLSR